MENKNRVIGRPFKKGNKGKPKGAVNIITKTVKEGILNQFCSMQDDPNNEAYKNRLEKFAAKYPRDFYAIAAKLIPTEIVARLTKVELKIVRTNGDIAKNPASLPEPGNADSEAV